MRKQELQMVSRSFDIWGEIDGVMIVNVNCLQNPHHRGSGNYGGFIMET